MVKYAVVLTALYVGGGVDAGVICNVLPVWYPLFMSVLEIESGE
jgi:hypothetical protein